MLTDQRDSYLCSICQRPIHPSEGALCVVCREQRREQRRARLDTLMRVRERYRRLCVARDLVTRGVYSDWPSGYPDHAWIAKETRDTALRQRRLDIRMAVFLAGLGVEYDTEGRDSWGDQWVSGWWRTGWGTDAA